MPRYGYGEEEAQSWEGTGVEELALRFRKALWGACDASMPRVRRGCGRRLAYWWTEEIAKLREASVRAKRRLQRYLRRRHRSEAGTERARGEYREARCSLGAAIGRSKTRAWEDLIFSLNEDPWGRPYCMVLKKLRLRAPPTTESLDPEFLGEVVGALFPGGTGDATPFPLSGEVPEWREDWEVSEGEMRDAVREMKTNKAPGPDGIPGKVWALVMGEVGGSLRYLFSRCLREGVFPFPWKEAKLVLPKGGRDPTEPSAYRPLCLLDEVGKLMERIVVGRLNEHLRENAGLSERQFGFRAGRPTIDAVVELRACSEQIIQGGGGGVGCL